MAKPMDKRRLEESIKLEYLFCTTRLKKLSPKWTFLLKSFGLIPELIGRLPVLTYLNPLDREALHRILTEPKNSIIKQYQELMSMDGIQLTFEDDALNYIVDKAVEFKLGARGLRSIVESIMRPVMFELPSQKVKKYAVTKAYAEEQLNKTSMM